jgi:bacterioferritin (cytochrome b1)
MGEESRVGGDELLKTTEEVAQAIQSLHIQLRVHRNMLSFWSYTKLSREYGKCQEDFSATLDALIRHALGSDRQLDLTPSLKINIGQTVEEILVSDRSIALSVSRLAAPCLDSVLLAPALAPVQQWQAFLDQQLEIIRQMGLPPYLALMAEPKYNQVVP